MPHAAPSVLTLTRAALRQRLRWLEARRERALTEARECGERGAHDDEASHARQALRLGEMVERVTRELNQ